MFLDNYLGNKLNTYYSILYKSIELKLTHKKHTDIVETRHKGIIS